jgi:kinesin family protein C1
MYFAVCIFSYGQTGSGKTYTMTGSGTGDNRGIIPRALELVGKGIDELGAKGWVYHMDCTYVEIYNERIRDLLRETDEDLSEHEVKRDADGNVFVSNTNVVELDPRVASEVQNVLDKAAGRRSVAVTNMNEQSSRSHSIFTLRLAAENSKDDLQLQGSLSLVDLAGSERLDRSGATGDTAKEAMAINKSLSALADVFLAIRRKDNHIPYRNSKLTNLLQPALGGDGRTLMLVALSPTEASSFESYSSCRFAAQVNKCELGKPKKMIFDLSLLKQESSIPRANSGNCAPSSDNVDEGDSKSVSSQESRRRSSASSSAKGTSKAFQTIRL